MVATLSGDCLVHDIGSSLQSAVSKLNIFSRLRSVLKKRSPTDFIPISTIFLDTRKNFYILFRGCFHSGDTRFVLLNVLLLKITLVGPWISIWR